MSRRILKLCVASLLNILCFPGMYNDNSDWQWERSLVMAAGNPQLFQYFYQWTRFKNQPKMLIMDILCSQDFKTKYLWHHRISGTVSLYIGKPILIWIRISDLIESWKSCQENYYLIRSSQLTIFIFDDNSPTSHKWNICRQEKASKRKSMLFLSTQLAGPVFATTSVCE